MCDTRGFAECIQEWTREVYAACDGDWKKISAHIQARMESLSPEQRERINAEISLTLHAVEPSLAGSTQKN
jgi:leucyl aminopeptidase (aminopeptidase T)